MSMKPTFNEKLIAYLTLLSGLTISAVAVYYSVAGLTAIFAAAVIPIVVMGVVLEVSKLVATVWLKQNWKTAPTLIKSYLWIAIFVLMGITSMGIFGFLSKAHLDQNVPTGDIVDKVAIIDEKIKTQRENIDAARKSLQQMDQSVDQLLSRSTSEDGASKSAQLRRNQQRERTALQREISNSQSVIAKLNEERAPLAKELRKVEAEVGPIKYIAAFVYDQQPDNTMLEKAVTWVIILLVIVFDPLAVVLLLAAQTSFQQFKEREKLAKELELSTPSQPIEPESKSEVPLPPIPTVELTTSSSVEQDFKLEDHPYLFNKTNHFGDIKPVVYSPENTVEPKVETLATVEVPLENFNKLTPILKTESNRVTKVFPKVDAITTATQEPVLESNVEEEAVTEASTSTIDVITPDEYLHISEEKHQEIVINKWVEDIKAGRASMAEVPKAFLLEVRGRI